MTFGQLLRLTIFFHFTFTVFIPEPLSSKSVIFRVERLFFVFFFTIFRETKMLYTIAVILFILWLLGLITTHVMGGFVPLLLIAAVGVLLFGSLSGRRSS